MFTLQRKHSDSLRSFNSAVGLTLFAHLSSLYATSGRFNKNLNSEESRKSMRRINESSIEKKKSIRIKYQPGIFIYITRIVFRRCQTSR